MFKKKKNNIFLRAKRVGATCKRVWCQRRYSRALAGVAAPLCADFLRCVAWASQQRCNALGQSGVLLYGVGGVTFRGMQARKRALQRR